MKYVDALYINKACYIKLVYVDAVCMNKALRVSMLDVDAEDII